MGPHPQVQAVGDAQALRLTRWPHPVQQPVHRQAQHLFDRFADACPRQPHGGLIEPFQAAALVKDHQAGLVAVQQPAVGLQGQHGVVASLPGHELVFEYGSVGADQGERVEAEGPALDREIQHARQPRIDVADRRGHALHMEDRVIEVLALPDGAGLAGLHHEAGRIGAQGLLREVDADAREVPQDRLFMRVGELAGVHHRAAAVGQDDLAGRSRDGRLQPAETGGGVLPEFPTGAQRRGDAQLAQRVEGQSLPGAAPGRGTAVPRLDDGLGDQAGRAHAGREEALPRQGAALRRRHAENRWRRGQGVRTLHDGCLPGCRAAHAEPLRRASAQL